MFGEEFKESLGKSTLLIRYDHQRRLESMINYCDTELNDVQEQSAKRHGKLMQKIAKEQQLLDKERMETKQRQQKFNKKRSEGSLDQHTDTRPPLRMPSAMGKGVGGLYGGMGPYGGGMGVGGGMQNYNMSNAIDIHIHSMDDTTPPPIVLMPDNQPCAEPSLALVYRDDSLLPSHTVQPATAVDASREMAEGQSSTALLDSAYLSSSRVANLEQIEKLEMLEKYFDSEKEAWSTNSFHFQHHMEGYSFEPKENENTNAVVTGLDVNHNVNAVTSDSSYDETTSDDHASKAKGKKSTKSAGKSAKAPEKAQSKVGGFASKIFGFGKKKAPTPTTSASSSDSSSSSGDTTGSNSDGSTSGTSTSGDSRQTAVTGRRNSQGPIDPPNAYPPDAVTDAGDIEYKEFEPNEHKDKWSLKQICKCFNMDTIVDRCCPCLRNRYQDFKEKREEKKHKKAMRKDVLLRLRDEASRSRNV